MTLWLIRAGSRGEHEQKFLDEGRVYVAWDGLDVDLGALLDRQGLIRVMEGRFPDEKAKALVNWSSQVWPFVKEMAKGDWVVMPSKLQSGLYFGRLAVHQQIQLAAHRLDQLPPHRRGEGFQSGGVDRHGWVREAEMSWCGIAGEAYVGGSRPASSSRASLVKRSLASENGTAGPHTSSPTKRS